ncbi:MAG: ABC transporter permease [Halobacteriota archaeon]|nr:ABC transporter permease [Halobacteriota archaeon]
MSKLPSTVKWDMWLQYKYGFYYVYAIVTFLYIILLRQLPEGLLGIATTFVIFTDPGFLGFLFIGAIIFFEKSEQTLNALTVTPLKVNEYIFSKTLSLTILALITSLIIVIFSYGIDFNYLALILGVILTSFFFTLIGFIAVAKFNTLNEYFLTSVFYMIILTLPLIDLFQLLESPLFLYLIPTQASLVLLQSAFEEVASWEVIYAVLYLIVWVIFIYRWAHRSFYRYIIMKQKARALGEMI